MCKSCGGGSPFSPWAAGGVSNRSLPPGGTSVEPNTVVLKYTGKRAGTMTYKANGRSYQAGGNIYKRLITVNAADATTIINKYPGEFGYYTPDLEASGPEVRSVSASPNIAASAVLPGATEVGEVAIPAVEPGPLDLSMPVAAPFDGDTTVIETVDDESKTDFRRLLGITPKQVSALAKIGVTTAAEFVARPQDVGLVLNVTAMQVTDWSTKLKGVSGV